MAIELVNDNELFRVPEDLRVTHQIPLKLLTVGSCLISGAVDYFKWYANFEGDYILFNNAGQLPKEPPSPIASYDLQIVQIPLRSILYDGSFECLAYDDQSAYQQLFVDVESRLHQLLHAAMAWNRDFGIATLVVNFLQPQQNPNGRLLSWHDMRNIAFFVAKLNESLEREVRGYQNAYVINYDEIAADFGRKFIQDDVLWAFNHGAALGDNDNELDQGRLHPPAPASAHYTSRVQEFLRAILKEIIAFHRTLRGTDSVKLVIVDLDDTLWRGVLAENGSFDANTVEGWPLGVVEALLYLKKRGILLAIASKNDEERIRSIWNSLFGNRLRLSDFVSVKINWQSKNENIAEILREINILPGSVVFLDDNPVERAVVAEAFPGIRTLGADLYYIRRVLLWSAETQAVAPSAESGRRTEMVQAQIERDNTRKIMSRADFVASLKVRIDYLSISSTEHLRFGRALELINKTNQFNTTGQRWTLEEARAAFLRGVRFETFEVSDKFTDYGLVGVAIVSGFGIDQFVMSCRVIGLDVEQRAIDFICRTLFDDGRDHVGAVYKSTSSNNLCSQLFENVGFRSVGNGLWSLENPSGEKLDWHRLGAMPK